MSGDDSGRIHEDLLAQQAAFFESYFKKGAEFTRELMQETQRLRARLAEVEERLADQDRANELEQRYAQIERENNDLAALYVAQSQLHSSLKTSEVVQVIAEILLNFVGADRFAIMLLDSENRLRAINSAGIATDQVPGEVAAIPMVAKLLDEGGVHNERLESRDFESAPICAMALQGGSGPFGAVVIWGFLQQKQEVSELDQQIFDLVANNGGLALQASRLVSEARQRVRTETGDGPFESFSRLLQP